MATYQLLSGDGGVYNSTTHQYIPSDPNNNDWKLYVSWLSQGNIPDPMPSSENNYDAVIYTVIALSGGDQGEENVGNLYGIVINSEISDHRHLHISGGIYLNPQDPQTCLSSFNGTWRITIRKVISEFDPTPIDSIVQFVDIINGTFSIVHTADIPGTYQITHDDFALVPVEYPPLSNNYIICKILLINNPLYYKAYSI